MGWLPASLPDAGKGMSHTKSFRLDVFANGGLFINLHRGKKNAALGLIVHMLPMCS
jgi:hypothetical protein